MCWLKSDGKSCTAYKVFKWNFYIGSVKKKIYRFKKKKKKKVIFSTNMASLFCHLSANQKSNPSSLHVKRDLFVVCGYNRSPVLKVNYQKDVTLTTNSAIFSLFCTKKLFSLDYRVRAQFHVFQFYILRIKVKRMHVIFPHSQ